MEEYAIENVSLPETCTSSSGSEELLPAPKTCTSSSSESFGGDHRLSSLDAQVLKF